MTNMSMPVQRTTPINAKPKPVTRSKKKKKSGFRPGFGRELSVAESAALQMGKLSENQVAESAPPKETIVEEVCV
jgi:hypothetical protein